MTVKDLFTIAVFQCTVEKKPESENYSIYLFL